MIIYEDTLVSRLYIVVSSESLARSFLLGSIYGFSI